MYLGQDIYDLSKGTELKSDHNKYSETVATVNSDSTITKVEDYYVDNKIKYGIK